MAETDLEELEEWEPIRHDNLEEVNRHMEIPEKAHLFTEDGRRFSIISWRPHISVDEPLTIAIRVTAVSKKKGTY